MTRFSHFISEVNRFFFCPKVYIALLFQFALMHFFTSGIRALSIESGCKSSIWLFPFLFGYVYLQLTHGLVTTYIFSSVPFMERKEIYTIIRKGRKRWLADAYAKIVGVSILIAVVNELMSILVMLPYISLESGWGKIYKTIALTDAATVFDIQISVPYLLINQFSPFEATLNVMFRMIILSITLGIIMFTVGLMSSGLVAVITGTCFSSLVIIKENLAYFFPWIRYISPFSWMNLVDNNSNHIDSFDRWNMYLLILSCVVIICVAIDVHLIRRIDFNFIDEEE